MHAAKELLRKPPNQQLIDELKNQLIMRIDGSDKARKGPLIQGGNFRMDIGPSAEQAAAFEWAAVLHEDLRSEGLKSHLCCIFDDMRLEPERRPRNANLSAEEFIPGVYLKILKETNVPVGELVVFFEASLRNWVDRDIRHKLKKGNGNGDGGRRGIEWPDAELQTALSADGTTDVRCSMLFGKFYMKAHEMGYPQIIGFYERGNTCGPSSGTSMRKSGYTTDLEVISYMVESAESIIRACTYDPEARITFCNPLIEIKH